MLAEFFKPIVVKYRTSTVFLSHYFSCWPVRSIINVPLIDQRRVNLSKVSDSLAVATLNGGRGGYCVLPDGPVLPLVETVGFDSILHQNVYFLAAMKSLMIDASSFP